MEPSDDRNVIEVADAVGDQPAGGVRTALEFWEGCVATFSPEELSATAISVKGCASEKPLRFLEIFANADNPSRGWPRRFDKRGSGDVARAFYPRIPGVCFAIGPDQPQPPYRWGESDPYHICRSFTYINNAFYRIFLNLCDQGRVRAVDMSDLFDKACLTLGQLYRLGDGAIMKYINNNLNMFFISKSVEIVVGKEVYDSECQEIDVTLSALDYAMRASVDRATLSTHEKMAYALGAGVAFIEERLCRKGAEAAAADRVERDSYAYFGRRLAIDHRDRFLAMIDDAAHHGGSFKLVVVVDDATETVADFQWITDLLEVYPYLNVSVLVSTAQISINFSAHMLGSILNGEAFRSLASRYGGQFQVVATYCPLISFQTNLLTPEAADLIASADMVLVKGANFYETLQLPEKETFYSFVVYGPVSRLCTGLRDLEAVWAHVPAGEVGYRFRGGSIERTLVQTVGKS